MPLTDNEIRKLCLGSERMIEPFREASAEVEHQHARQEEAAQRPLEPPPLFRAAKEKAARLARAGVTADDL